MAETFKNVPVKPGDSYATVYTAPNSVGTERAVLLGFQVTNVTSSVVTINAQMLDASNSNAAHRLAHAIQLVPGAAADILLSKTVLEAGDALQVSVSETDSVEGVLSILEMT